MERNVDVVIVGGGIGGGSLGTVLARAGVDVVIVEQAETYTDRVRGEAMMPWGVADVQALGLFDVLLAAGGHVTDRFITYDECQPRTESEAMPIPLDLMVPGVPGSLNVPHPVACQALAEAARAAGAEVVTGANDVAVEVGADRATVRWSDRAGAEVVVHASTLVGADGRGSAVRRAAGIGIEKREATVFLSGLLVEGLELEVPTTDVSGIEDDRYLLAFPMGSDRARLYLGVAPEQRADFAGPEGAAALLAATRLECMPDLGFADARPAGPCAAFPGEDSWTDRPAMGPVVLVGDAAGYSNPLAGQGLSITMRDVRLVSEAITASEATTPNRFDAYVEERRRRMHRIHFSCDVQSRLYADFSPGAVERRSRGREVIAANPGFLGALGTIFAGPDVFPEDTYTDAVRDAILGRT
jgi:2-polyprenyl-6-methoxyphenol hydroxylase-like FAD-dependent oxidoreductase